MRFLVTTLSFFALFFMAAVSANAGSSGWTVDRVAYPAMYTTDTGKTWSAVKDGMTMPDRAWINTGSAGRVVLRRGTETILVGPKSMAAAFKNGSGPRTLVHQGFGTVEIDVKKRDFEHMSVKTPFMAAVVKGTKFTVTSNNRRSTLSVERGLVAATDIETGETADVGAGGEARANSSGRGLGISGPNTSRTTGKSDDKAGKTGKSGKSGKSAKDEDEDDDGKSGKSGKDGGKSGKGKDGGKSGNSGKGGGGKGGDDSDSDSDGDDD